MTIEKNLKRNLPSFIIAQDVKSGYNNIIINDLITKFSRVSNKYYSTISHSNGTNPNSYDHEKSGINLLLRYIVKTPRLQIWEDSPFIYINKGVL